jgi:glycosyltransferase involved in cell wall biosynthesis
MKVSVIVCTYNRCRSLARALESLSASVMPATAEWEVLVMDNNSNDGTREVAQRFCELNPSHFRYLFEPTQGKSHALNTAIRESSGEILAFTDDDVAVEPSWLQNLTSVSSTKTMWDQQDAFSLLRASIFLLGSRSKEDTA